MAKHQDLGSETWAMRLTASAGSVDISRFSAGEVYEKDGDGIASSHQGMGFGTKVPTARTFADERKAQQP